MISQRFDLLSKARGRADQLAALASIAEWIRQPTVFSDGPTDGDSFRSRNVRVRHLAQLLERNPAWAERLAAIFLEWMDSADMVRILCQAGLSQETGFAGELSDRIARRVFPRPDRELDWAELLSDLFPESQDADWIEAFPEEGLAPLLAVIIARIPSSQAEALRARLKESVTDALLVLCSRAAALGVSDVIRMRLSYTRISRSPFVELDRRVAEALFNETESPARFSRSREAMALAEREIHQVYRSLESTGVSVNLVYKLEGLSAVLGRIQLLLDTFEACERLRLEKHIPRLLTELIRSDAGSRSVSGLLRESAHLLARKIIERTGDTGEHYIARSRKEYWALWGAAAGGGALTGLTMTIKLGITKLSLAPFMEGVLSTINYAGSFIGMQAMGFSLATKQPSMTASALAAKMEGAKGKLAMEEISREIILIIRSQLAAAAGNILFVIPSAFLLDRLARLLWHGPMMSPKYAGYFIESIDPSSSLTVFYAALTGVLLFASSIFAGWSENWVVYRRIPQFLAQSDRLAKRVGTQRAARWGEALPKIVSSLSGNISLGFLLAFTPLFGGFLGLPLDVRHVTLTTGALVMALLSLGGESVQLATVLWASAGVAVIGILNFGVSFALALEVAVRARQVPRAWVLRVLRVVLLRIALKPKLLFTSETSDLPAKH